MRSESILCLSNARLECAVRRSRIVVNCIVMPTVNDIDHDKVVDIVVCDLMLLVL